MDKLIEMIDGFINLLKVPKKIEGAKANKIVVKLEALRDTLNLNENGPLPFETWLLSIDKHTHGAKHICVECYYKKVTIGNPGRKFDQNIEYFVLDLVKEEAESFNCVFEGCDEPTTLKTITDSFIKA